MTFFNKKEDVINIELTPYGRSLIAKGELLPEYYAFFDDDILYDAMAAGESTAEDQNLIQTRILTETPRLKTQRDLISPESLIFSYERTEDNHRPHTKLKLNYLTEPLGTSEQTSNYGPAWKSTFIQGEISGSVQTVLTASHLYLRQIPQVNATIEYKMGIKSTYDSPPVSGRSVSTQIPASNVYADGTYLEITQEQILCQLKELQGFTFKDGLEMEVYLYEENSDTDLIPLKFRPQTNLIKNGILMDEGNDAYVELNPSYVEYWMDMNFDFQIPDIDICRGVKRLKARDIELDVDVECVEESGIDFDIYGTRITEIEDCD
jgi:hypothetical protein